MFGSSYNASGQSAHICGCYYQTQRSPFANLARHYLPQVKLDSHTTITPLYFTTKLTQTFRNTGSDHLKQVRYTFPLYDGVAVSGYTISYADKVLEGVVKQKDDAKKTYDDAVSRGETTGLLESLPAGVFGVTLGNVPASTDIVVKITYCGELKHDAAINGLRYTLPTAIAPRYGNYPGELMRVNAQATDGISITVDVDIFGSGIRKVQSPSHPIAVSMGATSAGSVKATFQPHQASATLTLGTTNLADDFVLQLLVDDIEKPRALIESHPTLPGHRAIMATLVPNFVLESANPEIVFVADQSGSMGGKKNDALVKALTVFLKSLPFGVRFNVCAFGSTYQFLWPKSQAYNEKNVEAALAFVESFHAGYGGTELLKPIMQSFEQRLGDMPLEVMVLTDGQIWGEDFVFDFINKQILEEKIDARVFALGIGNGASSTLVNGMARAGQGFAQFVTETETEKTDQKVMRMLKGALYAHTWDYKLDVDFDKQDSWPKDDHEEEDFEMIGKDGDDSTIETEDAKNVSATPSTARSSTTIGQQKPTRSFFDSSADLDSTPAATDMASRYAHLPAIEPPKLIQAPSDIPPLFPFNRTTAYILLDSEEKRRVKDVTLRASSASGPLELKIPVELVDSYGIPSVHQLAAGKAIQDLEEGRGSWLQPKKAQHSSRFDELIEREAVRLGVQYQVAGKWTSFVAVDQNSKHAQQEREEAAAAKPQAARIAALALPPAPAPVTVDASDMAQYQREMADAACMPLADEESDDDEAIRRGQHQGMSVNFSAMPAARKGHPAPMSSAAPPPPPPPMSSAAPRPPPSLRAALMSSAAPPPPPSRRAAPGKGAAPGGLFGVATQGFGTMSGGLFGSGGNAAPSSSSGGLFGSASPSRSRAVAEPFGKPAHDTTASFGSKLVLRSGMPKHPTSGELFGSSMQSSPAPAANPFSPTQTSQQSKSTHPMQTPMQPSFDQRNSQGRPAFGNIGLDPHQGDLSFKGKSVPPTTSGTRLSLHDLISRQKFSGAWVCTKDLLQAIGVQKDDLEGWKIERVESEDVKITLVVLAYLEMEFMGDWEVWERIAAKAKLWLVGGGLGSVEVDGLVKEARIKILQDW